MSTRSNIGILNDDGSVDSIYCHWDSYKSHNGKILLTHYKEQEKVKKLINLGDISSLREKVDPDPTKAHTFESPQDDVVIVYHRDRGEPFEDTKTKHYENKDEFIKGSDNDYTYLFDNGKWFCKHWDEKMKKLTMAQCKDK